MAEQGPKYICFGNSIRFSIEEAFVISFYVCNKISFAEPRITV